MEMRIQGGGYAPGTQDPQWQKRRNEFDALAKAISEGDLPAATDAYATIIGQLPVGGKVNPDSFLGKMGVALRSADLALARQLMANSGNRNGVQAASAASAPATAGNGRFESDAASPTLALNQAIQAGDQARARSAIQMMIDDLQQIANAGVFSGVSLGGAKAYATASSSVAAATNLLQNPNFQALEDAIAKGDPSGMKAAWAMLMSGKTAPTETPRKPAKSSANPNSGGSVVWDMQAAAVS